MVIWKYEIIRDKSFVLNMPKYCQILHLEKQGDTPCLWVEVPSDSFYNSKKVEYEEREFVIIGTGWEFGVAEIGDAGYYVGTWLEGPYVWHLYEKCYEEYPYVG
jgi:hypothetical protein